MLTQRAACLVTVLLVSLGLRSVAGAHTEAAVTIDVDATAPGTPLKPVWSYHGYDEVNYTNTPEGEDLLRTLAAAHKTPVYIRTHFLFNTGDGTPALKWGSTNIYTEDDAGNPVYDYTLIDQIMHATVDAGTFPLVEIGFMPQALSTQPDPYQNSSTYVLDGGCFYPPRDYAKWEKLVSAWAAHVKERYPGAEGDFQWELWNEPDIGYWQGTFDEFAELYDHTEAALHDVLPNASLGGPAVARPDSDFLTRFLEHCATGTNAVTKETGTRLDLVTFHAKGGVTLADGHAQMNLGNQLSLHRSGFEAVAGSEFADKPVVLTEADPDGCAACLPDIWPEYVYRISPAYGAYELVMMKRSLDLAEEMDVNLRGILTWAFTFPETPYFAGYRALATNGIHLPVLNAFKLLGSLSGDRLPVTSNGARPLDDILDNSVRQDPDVDALAASDGDRIQVLVYNYHDDLVDAEPAPVTLNVAVPPAFGAKALVTHTRVDDTRGDAYTVWLAQGSPTAPSTSELAELREAMQPSALSPEQMVNVASGTVSLSFDLPRFGISLVTLAPADDGERETRLKSGTICSCRLSPPKQSPIPALLGLLLAVAVVFGRRVW